MRTGFPLLTSVASDSVHVNLSHDVLIFLLASAFVERWSVAARAAPGTSTPAEERPALKPRHADVINMAAVAFESLRNEAQQSTQHTNTH